MKDIKTVGVIGTGIMGSGIAQVAATSGYRVKLYDISDGIIEAAMGKIQSSLTKLWEKRKIAQKPEQILGSISRHTSLTAMDDADFIVEAVPEVVEIKKKVFRELDEVCPDQTIFGSNTSQFSITELASSTKRGDRFIGTHWFNPAVIMKLIEVVRALDTSDETLDITLSLCKSFGKETVVCRKDTPGFITTRMLSLWGNEALRILEEGIATIEDIDKACKLGFGHPMGPFEINDFSGLDTSLRVRENLFAAYGERYRPGPTMRNLVNAGHWGRKTGRGYYTHTGGGND